MMDNIHWDGMGWDGEEEKEMKKGSSRCVVIIQEKWRNRGRQF